MDIGDSGELVRRLNALGELYNVNLSPARKALYFEALRDLPFDAVAGALNQAAKVCKFMPLPAEIRILAVGDVEDAVETAWMALKDAMRAAGAYASLVTTDAALGEAITAIFGNWPQACSTDLTPEMWSSKRKEFGRVYRVLKNRALAGSRYLAGIAEQQNAGRKDWLKYVQVFHLDGPSIVPLGLPEAEMFRTEIAAEAHGFTRIGRSTDRALETIPKGMEDAS